MKLLRRSGLAVLLLAWSAAGAAPRPFVPGSFAELVEARSGQPYLLVLWSTTCLPCRDEFRVLAELREQHGELPLVLVGTDPPGQEAMVDRMLEHFGLAGQENWAFADDDTLRLRFEIDAEWYGELPRSYFYAASGERIAASGKLERARLEEWIATLPR